MKNLIKLSIAVLLIGSAFAAKPTLKLSKDILKTAPFSDQFSEDGAMIRNIDFKAVNNLIPQLERTFAKELKGQKLEDRGESHITVITPPEGKTGFFKGSRGIDLVLPTKKMIQMYKKKMQEALYTPLCIGMQQNKDKSKTVFYIVINSEDIIDIRNSIYYYVQRKDKTIPFHPTKNYFSHITIGFVGGDVHGVDKSSKSCVANIELF